MIKLIILLFLLSLLLFVMGCDEAAWAWGHNGSRHARHSTHAYHKSNITPPRAWKIGSQKPNRYVPIQAGDE